MSDDFRIVERGQYIDLYFSVPVVKTRTIVSYDNDGKPRYMKSRGWAKYRGMYKSRRKVGFERSEWTNERSEAYVFDSPSAAKNAIAKEFGRGAPVARYRYEAIKMVGVDSIYMPAANTDYGVERHSVGGFKEVQS